MELAVEELEQRALAGTLPGNSGLSAEGQIPLAYFDHRALTRDCIAGQLAVLLPEFCVDRFASPFEIRRIRPFRRPSCIVFHTHSLAVGSARVDEELTVLGEDLSGVPVVVLSNLEASENVVDAIRHGAVAYIPTSLPLRTASEAIRLVHAGCSVMPIASRSTAAPKVDAMLARALEKVRLTPRQLAVLRQLGLGKQNKMIAYDLNMSEGTVKVHVKHIMRKLHANNRTQVVLMLQHGLRDASAVEVGEVLD